MLNRLSRCVAGWISIIVVSFLVPGSSASGEDLVLVPRAAEWAFLPGLAEASTPDLAAWRRLDFDDSSWVRSPASFGFGDPPDGTDLDMGKVPMRRNYTCVFLRRRFPVVADIESLVHYELRADYDDGFVAWINGVEVLRVNVAGETGTEVTVQDDASRSHESGSFDTFVLHDPQDFLVPGENILAVQAFNTTISSSDFKIDVELVDPFGPDITQPRVQSVIPAPGSTVRSLTQVEVLFSEPVSGVDAADLQVAGRPASRVRGADAGPYVFSFDRPAVGEVELRWSSDHGVIDFAATANAFSGEPWSYTFDPDAPPPSISITELLASNRGGDVDEDLDRVDWVEIHNFGETPINLIGWSLTDDRERPTRWVFPSITLAPDAYLVVFASGKDRSGVDGELHTDFRLNASGEYLGLFPPESPRVAVSEFDEFPEQRSDHSYGFGVDGQTGYFALPTPGTVNGPTVLGDFVEDLVFSVERGIYAGPFSLEITTPTPDTAVFYTLDGTEPGLNGKRPPVGVRLNGSVEIAGSPERPVVTLRAVGVRGGLLPSRVETHTYVFPEQVLRQSNNPSGFPRRWGAAPAVDYEMDPQIVDDARYTDLIRQGLVDLPSVSIVATVEDIFGPAGIYSNPQGEGVGWERSCSAELIHPGGEEGFQIDCGIRILGGASRQPAKSPKHSFRLLFKGDHGPTKLRHDLFEDSPIDSFDTLVLRANYNNSWIHWDTRQRSRGMLIRDQWMKDTLRDMGQPTTHGNFVNLYLNGLYWGVFNLVERPSAPFAADHMGGKKEEWDALNSGLPVDGDVRAWSQMLAYVRTVGTDPARYLGLDDHLDVDNLIDYMIANFYGANHDWDDHNWYSARRRVPGGQWRFFSWDAERVLEGDGDNVLGGNRSGKPSEAHQRLRNHPEYRMAFADRAHRHLVASGGALTVESAIARFEARAGAVERAVVAESARWGDYRRDVHQFSNGPYEFYRVDTHWRPERARVVSRHLPRRGGILLNQLRSAGLYPRVAAPLFSSPGGVIEDAADLEMSLPDGQGGVILYTLDGSDPRIFGTAEVSAGAVEYAGTLRLTDHTVVRARTRDGEIWSALHEARFTLPPIFDALVISEFMYNDPNGERNEFIELHNTGDITLDLGGVSFTNGVELTFTEGTSLAPGGYLVVVDDEVSFPENRPDVEIGGVYRGDLDDGGEKLTLKDSSGRTVVSVDYDDDGFWPVASDGFGRSLVLADAAGDPDDPRSWRSSTEAFGSPGADDAPPVFGRVIINEIASATDLSSAGVELRNLSDESVDVSGWFLSDGRESVVDLRRFRLEDGSVISPGGVLHVRGLLFRDELDIARAGGELYLSAFDEESWVAAIAGAEYGPHYPGTTYGAHESSTGLELTLLREPSLGAPNSAPYVHDVVINEINYHPAEVEGEEPDVEWIELRNRRLDRPVPLYLEALGVGYGIDGLRLPQIDAEFVFPPASSVPTDGFLLLVASDPDEFRARHSIPDVVPIVGPFGGRLDNSGERITLEYRWPGEDGRLLQIDLDRVDYNDREPWPTEAAGLGATLERIAPSLHGNDPTSWAASTVEGGTPGRRNSVTEAGASGGLQLPGDIDGNAALNLTDAVGLLGMLFQGAGPPISCDEAFGRAALLDANGDRGVNLSDAVFVLNHLFVQGPPHVLGTDCVTIDGCEPGCEGR